MSWGHCTSAGADGDWALTVYGARLTVDNLGDTLTFDASYRDSYLAVVGVSRRVVSFGKYADLEIEVQVAKHFGDQDHWEFNALPVIRWRYFPWNSVLPTSIAAGAGVSYALDTPKLEAEGNPNSSKLLGYLMFELAFSLPKARNWSIFGRIHHRSGAGGTISDTLDGSNAIGLGIRYSF